MSDGLNNFDMEKMLKVIEMAKMLENLNAQGEEHTVGEEQTNQRWRRLNNFDDKIQTELLRSVKVAIPFLNAEYQRNLSVIIKLLEIQKLSKYYAENSGNVGEQAFEADVLPPKHRQLEMLCAMRDELSGEARQKIGTIIKVLEATSGR